MMPGEMVPASPPREALPPAAQVMPMMAGAAGAVRR
jgi:hypothetical protein